MTTERAIVGRAAARGLVASMAMTGFRSFASGFSPDDPTPPEAIVEHRAPEAVRRLPEHKRQATTELLHWAYGAAAGGAYGLLPRALRRRPATGPVYGLAIWLMFEALLRPLLRIPPAQRRPVVWRAVLAADHMLYGTVVAGRLAPEPGPPRERRLMRGWPTGRRR
jgi:hypothetical protein